MRKLRLLVFTVLGLAGVNPAGAAEYDILQPVRIEGAYAVFQGTAEVQGNAFSVGGSTLAVRYGKVGIGLDTPVLAKLNVLSDTWGIYSQVPNNSYGLVSFDGSVSVGVGALAGSGVISTLGNQNLRFGVNNANSLPLTIGANGNLAVGVNSSSAYKLHVSSGAGETGTVMAVSTGATNLFWVAGDGAHAIRFFGDGSGLTGMSGTLTGGQTPKLAYWTAANSLGNANLTQDPGGLTVVNSTFTVQGNAFSVGGSTLVVKEGNIGIGTNTPYSKLAVAVNDPGTSFGGTAGQYALNLVNTNATANNYVLMTFEDYGGGSNAPSAAIGVQITDHTNDYGDLVLGGRSQKGWAEWMRLKAGNVGIGDPSPNYKLQVSSGAGEAGTIMAVSTGATNLFWVAGDGAHATRFFGDGSGLTGMSGTLSGGQTPRLAYWTAANNLGNSGLTQDSGGLTVAAGTFTVQGGAFSVGGSTFVVQNGNVGIGAASSMPLYVFRNVGAGPLAQFRNTDTVDGRAIIEFINDRAGNAGNTWRLGISPSGGTGYFGLRFNNAIPEYLTVSDSGNVGLGTNSQQYRLVVSSGAGEAGNMLVVSTGTSNVIRLTGDGSVYANRYFGDGAGLTGLGANDSLGTHIATKTLDMASFNIVGVSSVNFRSNVFVTSAAAANYGGVYVSSHLYVNGKIYGDGSTLTGLAGGDSLGTHVATKTLSMGGFGIVNVASLTASGYLTTYSSMSVGGILGAGAIYTAGVSSFTGAAYFTGVSSFSNVANVHYAGGGAGQVLAKVAGGGMQWADVAAMVSGDNMGTHVATKTVDMASFNLVNVSSVNFKGNVFLTSAPAASYGGVYASTHVFTPGNIYAANYFGNASNMTGLPQGDSLGTHIATQTLDMGGFGLVNVASITASGYITTYSSMSVAGLLNAGSVYTAGISSFTSAAYFTGVSSFSNVANVHYAGGNAGQVLSKVAGGGMQWADVASMVSGDNMGTHVATRTLDMASFNIVGVSSVNFRSNVFVTSAAAGNYGGVYVSSHLYVSGKIYGDGSTLTGLPQGDSLGTHIATKTVDMGSFNLVNVSSVNFKANVFLTSAPAANYGGVYVSSHLYVNGKLYGDGSLLSGISGGDSLGTHIATQTLRMQGYGIQTSSHITAGAYQINGSTVLAILGGNSSFAVGFNFSNNSTGEYNVFVGSGAGRVNTTGRRNTFVGAMAGFNNDNDQINTFVGSQAGYSNNAGWGNAFMGDTAGYKNTSGSENTILGGYMTGYENTTGAANTFVGNYAGQSNTQGGFNTYVGYDSGGYGVTGEKNVSIGASAGADSDAGSRNVSVGFEAAYSGMTFENTALGYQAARYNVEGGSNVAVGAGAGLGAGGNSYAGNSLLGWNAGYALTTGGENTFLGWRAGNAATSGSRNVVIGRNQGTSAPSASDELNLGGVLFGKLDAKTIGISTRSPQAALDIVSTGTASNVYAQVWRNASGVEVASMTSMGVLYATMPPGSGDNLGNHTATQALMMGAYAVNTSSFVSAAAYQIGGATVVFLTGSDNLHLGRGAGVSNTGGYGNVFVGESAGYPNTDGFINTIVGAYSGNSNTTGSYNSFFGNFSAIDNSTGWYNSVFGAYASRRNRAGSTNAIFGSHAGYGTSGFSYSSSTIMGYKAGYSLSSGSDNIFLGWQAGYNVTTGTGNIVIGYDQRTHGAGDNNRLNIGGVLFGDLANRTIGISTRTPQAVLDIVSTGTASNIYAQIWRNGGGTIVASMTSQGVLYASLPPGSGDNLGNHAATQNLNLAQYSAVNVASLTMVGKGLQIGTDLTASANGVFISTAGQILTLGLGNGTATPNARGTGAVDLQTRRLNATEVASGPYSVLTGGYENTASGDYSFVGGGYANKAQLWGATVGGGTSNTASGGVSVVAGGDHNIAMYDYDTVSGGLYNEATGGSSTVSGGDSNKAKGWYSAIPGGYYNVTSGNYSFAAGFRSSATANGTFSWSDSQGVYTPNIVQDRTLFKSRGGFMVTGSTSTNMTGAKDRGMLVTGDGLVGISTGTPMAALDVVSSATASNVYAQIWRNGSGVPVASMTSTGQLYATVSGVGSLGNHTATQDLNMSKFGIVNVSTISGTGIYISSYGVIQSTGVGTGTVAGNSRGVGAVDLQVNRGVATRVASGAYSVISGGQDNTASNQNSTVGGGSQNTAGNQYSTVGGGVSNNAGGDSATVPGGAGNVASGNYSFAAGRAATASGVGSFMWADSGNISVNNNVQDRVRFKAAGGFMVSGSTNAAMAGGVNRGLFVSGDGLLGISTGTPQAALDVVSSATASNVYAQIWRNASGVVVASMTSQGTLYTVAPILDNLGNHTAGQDLNLAGFDIYGVTGLTGDFATLTSSVTIVNAVPTLKLYETDAAADEHTWHMRMESGILRFQAIADAGGGGGQVLDITRTGNQASALKFGVVAAPTLYAAGAAGGSVGIGTGAPQALLEVFKNQAAESAIFINNPNAGGYPALRLGPSDRATNGDFMVFSGAAASGLRAGNRPLVFQTGAANTEAMRISSDGRVGIGITPVFSTFTVYGTLGSVAGSSVTFMDLHSNTGNADRLVFLSSRATTGATWVDAGHIIKRRVDVTDMGYIRFGSQSSDPLTFGLNQTEYMRLDNTGNLALGSTAPGARLDVKAAGVAPGVMAQIWRNSAGTIVSSVSATGMLTASGMQVSKAGANQGDILFMVSSGPAAGQEVFYVRGNGFVYARGGVTYAGDMAELYAIEGEGEAGDVIMLGEAGDAGPAVKRATKAGTVLGIIATEPGITIGHGDIGQNGHRVPVALSGRVPVKISLENGPVKAGTMLAASSIPGRAAAAVRTGVVIGMALEDFDPARGEKVLCFVNRQYWVAPEEFERLRYEIDALRSEIRRGR